VVCEAKNNWIYLSKKQRKNFHVAIADAVQNATDDLQHTLSSFKADYGMALNFFPTYSKQGNNAIASMKKFHEAIRESGCSFFALYENTTGNNIVSSKKNVCNSVALIGNVVKR
jgi:hypothetical protein